jgi:1-acyl-sn-glycerol-3-phosphate acyltransferase
MRTPLVTLTALVMTAILAPAVVVARLLGVKEGPNSFYERCMRAWARSMIAAAGVTIRIHDVERVARDHGAIYISNHVSWFDVLALAAVLPRYTFVAKTELRRIPLFGWGAEAAGIVFLDRDNRKQAFASYKVAAGEVERGRSIVVCPEGTRGFDYHLRPFKKGPFVLAIAAQAPIIPTFVYGQREVMRKGSFRIHPGVVHIHLLEPVETKGYGYDQRAQLMELVWHRIADGMRELYGTGTSEHAIASDGASDRIAR